MSAMDTLPPPVPLSQKPVRIIKAKPPNRPPPNLPPKPPQKPPPCPPNPVPIPVKQSVVELPESCVAEPAVSGISVKKIAGLFQKDYIVGNGEDSHPPIPPKPAGILCKEEKVLPEKTSDSAKFPPEVQDEKERVSVCPPPLPPKLSQDPGTCEFQTRPCEMQPACPSQCCCACHQHRPGLVLVWVPESFVSQTNSVNEASDSSDDGGIFNRILSINADTDEGKLGILKSKMSPSGSYPVRRRSQRYGNRSQVNDGDDVSDSRNSVVLTSYKFTSECSVNGDSACPTPEELVVLPQRKPLVPPHRKLWTDECVDSVSESSDSKKLGLKTKSKDGHLSEGASGEEIMKTGLHPVNGPPEVLSKDFGLHRPIDSAPELPLSGPPCLRSHKPNTDQTVGTPSHNLESNFETDSSRPETLMLKNTNTFEIPHTDGPSCKEQADSRTRIRKPARRSKLPPPSVNGEDPPLTLPPKVPSKPPRGAAPPPPPAPPPFLRKGSLKRYSVTNPEEMSERDKMGSTTSLPIELSSRTKGICTSSSDDSNDLMDSSQESSVFRSPTIKSPRSIDWESHLRDEPLYQTYRQAVITKEIRRQTVTRNSSFTSYDYSHDSPVSSGGSPKQGRRSATQHNTLWQELPAVRESGVLDGMTNEQKKMQESMFEVLTSEASYLRSLNVLTEHFLGYRDLLDCLIIRERKILFSNILKVKEVSESFLSDLEARVDESILITDVCDIILHHAVHHFSVYIDYVRNQLYQEKTYTELMEKNPQFHSILCRLQDLPQCQRLPFMSFLLLPFQRITRIKMLIENILKRTEEGSESEENASNALEAVTKIIEECNREVGRMKQTEELIHIAQKIEFDKIKAIPIISQSRFLEKQGELSEVLQKGSLFGIKPTKQTPVYFFLFNDFLLITQKKSSDRHLVLDYAHRSLVQIQSCPTMENSFFLTLLENHQGKTCDRLFKASTQSDLHRWMAAFPNQKDDSFSGSETIYEDWDCPQVQCVDQYSAVQTDELSLDPADIINVLRKTSEGWYEGIRLSDGKKGWFPASYAQEITNEHVRRRNLRERYRVLQAARQIQLGQTVDHKKKASSA
ncbi:rho guanine nucleotide exchange factor 15-like [Pelobates fuscus]|uniref:rho guanine nucleotide exchange factor 15-like n=1 Tax=Pelobates fuscus TaxID=191477 RepID=UPI002FE4B050